jgi:hypothetical protein
MHREVEILPRGVDLGIWLGDGNRDGRLPHELLGVRSKVSN